MRIKLLFLFVLLYLPNVALFAETEHNSAVNGESLDSAAVVEKMKVVPYSVKAKQFILPGSLIALGAMGSVVDGWDDFHLISRRDSVDKIRIDDYMEWGMFGWVFICDLFAKEKHNFVDQFFLLAIAEAYNAGMIHGLKNTIEKKRPDGRRFSFPSGHTANAFLGAHLAFKEFKDSAPALAYTGYIMAAGVGALRVYNNRHWVSDVLAGAGIGILSVELSYLTYFPIRNAIARNVNARAAKNLVIAPSITPYGGGVYFSLKF